ncbi:DEKNAAC102689 [Brettanomyces naardenensis]|uniref:DEKNAAC102690 n=1 Tax=Brettanomyces naardenensis TaxID=13370 RepID=A0A448YKP0_BRENA|nr:DEKNAAC102689 [Brettanomyces naardenensis]
MGRPRLILLVRHGESQGNRDKSVNRYIPNHKVPLTEHGHEQAKHSGQLLRKYLKEDDSICFYTSPYLRARQTLADIIEEIDDLGVCYKVFEEPRMREQDFGNFQSTPEDMQEMWVERAKYGHFFYRIPFGESAADVYDRCASFNTTLFRQFDREDFPSILVLVTHGIWARVFLMKWFRWKVEYFENLQNIPHCSWLVMERDEKNDRYKLKTHMATWSELEDRQREEKMKEDASDELQLSANAGLSANEVSKVVNAAVKAEDEQVRNAKYDHLLNEADGVACENCRKC